MAAASETTTKATATRAFPPQRLKHGMVKLLSNPETLNRIAVLVAERAALVPQTARDALKGDGETPTNPTDRRMTADVLRKYAPEAVARWEEIAAELDTLRKSDGCARGNKHCGHMMSNMMEWLVGELLKAATKTVHEEKRTKMRPSHIIIDEDADVFPLWYPLVANLPSFVSRAEKDDADDADDTDKPEEPEEPKDAEEDEDDEDAAMANPQCYNSATKVNRAIIEITGFKTAMTQQIRLFLQRIVVELLAQLAEMVRAALKFKGQSTLNEEVLQFVLRLLFIQGGRAEDGELLIKRFSIHLEEKVEDPEGKKVPVLGLNLGADFSDLKELEKIEPKRRVKRDNGQAAPQIPKPSGGVEAAEEVPAEAKAKGKKAAAEPAPAAAPAKRKKAAESTEAAQQPEAAEAPEAKPAAKGKGKKAAAPAAPTAAEPAAEAAPAEAKPKGKKAAMPAAPAAAVPAAEAAPAEAKPKGKKAAAPATAPAAPAPTAEPAATAKKTKGKP